MLRIFRRVAGPTAAGPTVNDVRQDLRRRKSDLVREAHTAIVANQPIPAATLDAIDCIGKVEATFEDKLRSRRRNVDLLAFCLTALVLAVLFLARLPRAEVDIELLVTGLQFELGAESSTNLIPGEAGQILALKRVAVTGIEDAPDGAADGGDLELRAETLDAASRAEGRIDPSVRLFAIALPTGAPTSVSTAVAYAGNSRGVSIDIQAEKATKADLGRLILAPAASGKGPLRSAVEPISIAGKHLEFTLYSSDETRDLAIFRNTRLTSVSFERSGSSEILSGEVHIRGRSEKAPIALHPSDLLLLRSEKPMTLRELSLSGGRLKVILSAPEAEEVRLGGVTSQDLRPSLLEWLLYRWPNELYVAFTAVIALWLSTRRWWNDLK